MPPAANASPLGSSVFFCLSSIHLLLRWRDTEIEIVLSGLALCCYCLPNIEIASDRCKTLKISRIVLSRARIKVKELGSSQTRVSTIYGRRIAADNSSGTIGKWIRKRS